MICLSAVVGRIQQKHLDLLEKNYLRIDSHFEHPLRNQVWHVTEEEDAKILYVNIMLV